MTLCAQMWDQLGAQAIDKLKMDQNQLRDWGAAWMRRKKKTCNGSIHVHGMSMLIDGYLAYMFTLNDEWLQLDVKAGSMVSKLYWICVRLMPLQR